MERLCSGIVLEARALGLSYFSRGPLNLRYVCAVPGMQEPRSCSSQMYQQVAAKA